MSTHLVLQADHVSPASLVDASAHRADLPPVYNAYTRVSADPAYDRAREAEIALFRPLFTTSFLLADFLAEERFFGARSVVMSSASSKTALGLASLLAGSGHDALGLTSAANAPFVARTGYFTTVQPYDDIGALPREIPTVFVDFAGNAAVVSAVHRHFGPELAYSARVGVTHWEKMTPPDVLPGPAPVFFFAPDQARKRIQDWGAGKFQTRVGDAMRRFVASTVPWLRVVEGRGGAPVESLYRAMLEGAVDPAEGHVLSL